MHRRAVAALGLIAISIQLEACDDPQAAAREPKIELVDVAGEAGIGLVQVSGDPRRWYILESNGTGAAWLDYDLDGDMDVFVGNGQGLKYVDDGATLEVVRSAKSALYRNDGGLKFTDVSAATGGARDDWMQGIASGDVDNDGDTDLYLACFGGDVFLRNDKGKFTDATVDAGLGNKRWAASAAFGDVNNDGALDLYVANYCEFDLAHPPAGGKRNVIEGVEVGWGPEEENQQGFNRGAPDVFYLGDGRGHFREQTLEAGLVLAKPLCSYQVVFSDVDGNGWQDILVANDLQPANLFINQGAGKFVEEGAKRGFALDADGKATGAMGLSVEDFDRDGDFDVFRTNFDFEANSLHVNDGRGYFEDRAERLGLAAPSVDKLGWGGGFFDVECDGDLDLLVANGHVYPQAKQIGMSGWEMPTQLYEAVPGANGALAYRDVTASAGSGLAPLRSARGIAFADADDDGDVDALVLDLDHAPRFLRNDSVRQGHWLSVRTVGQATNACGIGANVQVKAGGRTWTREMRTTQGQYSSHDPRLHFGLGDVKEIDSVEVLWPSGRRSFVAKPALDAALVVEEPDELAEPKEATR